MTGHSDSEKGGGGQVGAGRAGLTPAEASLRGRLGAHVLHATYDSRAITAKARAAFLARFEQQVDPAGALPPDERRRRADHLRKAHFARLALKSAQARRRKAKGKWRGRSPSAD